MATPRRSISSTSPSMSRRTRSPLSQPRTTGWRPGSSWMLSATRWQRKVYKLRAWPVHQNGVRRQTAPSFHRGRTPPNRYRRCHLDRIRREGHAFLAKTFFGVPIDTASYSLHCPGRVAGAFSDATAIAAARVSGTAAETRGRKPPPARGVLSIMLVWIVGRMPARLEVPTPDVCFPCLLFRQIEEVLKCPVFRWI